MRSNSSHLESVRRVFNAGFSVADIAELDVAICGTQEVRDVLTRPRT